jgi:hypothetical protein
MNRFQKAVAAREAQRVSKPCNWCEQDFKALKISKFCSNRCRQAAKNARAKGTHKLCPCGRTFDAADKRRKFCGECR